MNAFLFILGSLLFLWLLAVAISKNRPWRRTRSAREEALHDTVQQAMNWTEYTPHECEDGKWRDCRGREYQRISLNEIFEEYQKNLPPGHRRKKK